MERKVLKIKFTTASTIIIIAIILLVIIGVVFIKKSNVINDNANIEEQDINEKNETNENINDDETETKFSNEAIKQALQSYLDLVGYKEASPEQLLVKLGLMEYGEYNNQELTEDNYKKTNVKYVDYKNKMLEYMSEELFDSNFTSFYKEQDGYLYFFDGGATGLTFEVESVSLKGDYSDLIYIGKVYNIAINGTKSSANLEFHIQNNNGKCIITYCDKFQSKDDEEEDIEKEVFSNDVLKQTLYNYLSLVTARENAPELLLVKLGLMKEGEYNNQELTEDNYKKTNIKYSDYKNKMLEYVTEEWFNTNFTNFYKEVDGYLYFFDGGASRTTFEVESVELKGDYSNLIYIGHLYTIAIDGTKSTYNIEFHVQNDNGRCLITYCDI